MPKLPLYLPEQVCLNAVEGKLTLTEAAELFLEVVPDEDYLEFACPGYKVLFELSKEYEGGEYEARLMAFFTAMLNEFEFTRPQILYQPPLTYPLSRSAPDQK